MVQLTLEVASANNRSRCGLSQSRLGSNTCCIDMQLFLTFRHATLAAALMVQARWHGTVSSFGMFTYISPEPDGLHSFNNIPEHYLSFQKCKTWSQIIRIVLMHLISGCRDQSVPFSSYYIICDFPFSKTTRH